MDIYWGQPDIQLEGYLQGFWSMLSTLSHVFSSFTRTYPHARHCFLPFALLYIV